MAARRGGETKRRDRESLSALAASRILRTVRLTTRKRETRCAFCVDVRMRKVIATSAKKNRDGQTQISMSALHRLLQASVPGIPELPALQAHISRHAGGWTK